jgi:hypothetical protein
MLSDVRRDVWSELAAGRVSVGPFRRMLQRAYLTQADAKLNSLPAIVISTGGRSRRGTGPNSDVRAIMRGELIDLDASLRSAADRSADRATKLHILDARTEIKRILDPRG